MKSILKLNRLIVFFISIGYLVLAFEIYTQHFDQLAEKKIMWTPIIFGVVGGIVGLIIAFYFNKLSFYFFHLLMFTSILVGCLGLYLHNRWRLPAFINFLFYKKPFDFQILTTYTPLLAPSAFIVMGGLGLLIAIFEGWGCEDVEGLKDGKGTKGSNFN